MLFAVICFDKKGGSGLRSAKVSEHLAYLRTGDVVKLAGPFTDEKGGMIGSLLLIEAANRQAADTWVKNEPFAKAGLFERCELHPWFSVINNLDPA
jgi:uncharacterized protein YciI